MRQCLGDVPFYGSFRDAKCRCHITLSHAVDPVQQKYVAIDFGQFAQCGQAELQCISCN